MSADNFFGGADGLSFADPKYLNQIRGGRIVEEPVEQQMTQMGTGTPLFWDDAKTRPKMQLIVTLQCDGSGPERRALNEKNPNNYADTGKRRLYIRSYMVNAVGDAIRSAGAEGLRVGGHLYVAWTGTKQSKTPGFGDAKTYHAMYFPPQHAMPQGSTPPASAVGANPFGAQPQGTGAMPVQQPTPGQYAPVHTGQIPMGQQPVTNPYGHADETVSPVQQAYEQAQPNPWEQGPQQVGSVQFNEPQPQYPAQQAQPPAAASNPWGAAPEQGQPTQNPYGQSQPPQESAPAPGANPWG